MATQRIALTMYRIRDMIDGQPVEKLEDAIADPAALTSYDLIQQHDFEARLYVAKPSQREPPWVEFLRPAFGELAEVADSVTNSAVLMAKVRYYKPCFFALTFGLGRYLLKPNSFRPSYGLRVALNAFYPSTGVTGEPTLACVRSVDSKTVAANTLYTRRQMDRRTIFEDFGVDVQRDLLKAVTGRPLDADAWGTRLTGAGSLHVTRPLSISRLGDLLKQAERVYRRKDYEDLFGWIDNVRVVADPHLRAALETHLLDSLKSGSAENLTLAAPELVEWDDIASVRFSTNRAETYEDLELQDYLGLLDGEGKLDDLTFPHLRRGHKVEAIDADNNQIYGWTVLRCISGELQLGGKTYLVSEGDFFEVREEYREELDEYIGQLAQCDKMLPDNTLKKTEGEYNKDTANGSPHYLLLDKETIKLDSKTSPIEICDILTDDGCFIHVKRKLESKSLSHLFAQGYVSGDLFLMSHEYRTAVRAKVRAAEEEREQSRGADEPSFIDRFSSFDTTSISPSNYQVVYGIVADWKGKDLLGALPFFSKVNLRRYAEDLRRMGYRVTYKCAEEG